jgi:SAM-dependent methyltransferase
MRFVTWALLAGGRVSGGVSSLFHYSAASTLRLAEMKEGIRRSWQGFNSREADITEGLMLWEKELLGQFVNPGAAVLVIGCGSGRDLIALAQQGCLVTGIEPASSALDIARRMVRERQISATLIEGFFEDVQVSGIFDVVIFSCYCYCYIPESRRRIAMLREAAAHLTTGGHILVSYPSMTRVRPVIISLARIVGALCGSDWRLEAGDLVIRYGSFYNYTHAFQPGEIEKEAAAAGLRVVYHRDFPDDPVASLVAD